MLDRFRWLLDAAGDAGAGGSGAPPAAGGSGTLLSGAVGGAATSADPHAGAAASSAWLKDDSGAFAEGWQSRLSGELKDHAALRAMGSLEDLAKSYVTTKGMVGKKLEMPGEGATPEQLASWRKTVGAPDTAEGYLGDAKTLRPEGIPETMWSAEGEKAFLAIAHKHHLSPAAVKDIMAHHAEAVHAGMKSAEEGNAQFLAGELQTLQDSWGAQFGTQLGLAKRVALTMGLDPASHPIFQSAEVVQAFAKMGKLFSETSLVQGETSSSATGGFDSRIKEIQDPKSQSMTAREYRGELGAERQSQAADALRALLKAQKESQATR